MSTTLSMNDDDDDDKSCSMSTQSLQKYSLKISQLSDYMKTHYNVLIPHELVDMTDDTAFSAAPSTTRAVANGYDYRLRVNDSCQRMDRNAAANYADDSNDRSSHHQQPQQQLYKPSMVACNNANTPPIPSNRTVMTASPSPHTATSPRPPPHPLPSDATTGESITTRQQQLERMVANLISRLEEVFSEDDCDDDDVHDDDDDGMQHYHYFTTDMTTGRHIRT